MEAKYIHMDFPPAYEYKKYVESRISNFVTMMPQSASRTDDAPSFPQKMEYTLKLCVSSTSSMVTVDHVPCIFSGRYSKFYKSLLHSFSFKEHAEKRWENTEHGTL
jgi:hypothetical protein